MANEMTDAEVASFLKGMRRMLKNRGITQPVRVQLTHANTLQSWVFRCDTLDDGTQDCRWVESP